MKDVCSLWHAPAVVVELETALACEQGRGVATFAALRSQLLRLQPHLQGEPEVVVVYDPNVWGQSALEALLDVAQRHAWPGSLEFAAAPRGTGYYEHKNFGFSLTRNPVVVFLDGDLLPEEDWLAEMLRPFEDFRVAAVVGNTYMDATSFYAKCVALFWIFETRASRAMLRRTTRLVSNSVAFRRVLFARCPFPGRDTYRGQCSELAAILASIGIPLYLNSGAQSCHPPPRGPSGFLKRALYAGHDECVYQSFLGPVGGRDALAAYQRDLRAVRTRINARARSLQAGRAVRAAAAVLGFTFYSVKLAGYLLTVAWPQAVQQLWPDKRPVIQPSSTEQV
jgi:hypothetical protein